MNPTSTTGDKNSYAEVAREIRKTVLSMIYKAQVSHIGSNFSAIDILTVLYSKADFTKDKLVVSKGWVAASIYALGVKYGLCPQEAIDTFCDGKSKYIGLIEPLGFFGAEVAGGSMGLGLPGAVGLALAKKLKGEDGKVYVLMSDGELAIGTTWESALIAAQHKLDNLVVIVDQNSWQAMGKTEDILKIPHIKVFDDLGWYSSFCDGHDFKDIEYVLDIECQNTPVIIKANTTKGKGVSFMENNNLFHYKAPNEEEYKQALKELNV